MRDCTELVTQARDGDREALGRLVAAVQDDVYHLLLSRLRNPADAEDAAQETFVQAIVSLPDLRDPRAFAGWLFRIALDKARRVKRPVSLDPASEPVAKAEEDAMEREESGRAVRKAVKGLDETLRTTVELRYEHGLAYADIARAMDCPEGTVADRLHTAHERLKRALAGAGVAITMALLERELSAAPRSPAPPRLASKLGQLAKHGRTSGPSRRKGPSLRKAAAAALLLALAGWLGVRSGAFGKRGASAPESGTDLASAAGSGSSNPAALPGAGPGGEGGSTPKGSGSAGGLVPAPTVGVVEGHVRDARSGRGIEGASVWLTADGGREPGGSAAKTDAQGAFRVEAPAGSYELHAYADGFVESTNERRIAGTQARNTGKEADSDAEAACRVRLEAGARESREVDLKAGVCVRGRVQDEHGLAIAGVAVEFVAQFVEEDEDHNGCTFTYDPDGRTGTATTDLEGKFAFPGLYPSGRAFFRVTHAGHMELGAQVELTGSDEEIVIELRRGLEIAGEVVDHLGAPVPGATLLLASPSERPASLQSQKTRTDADGRFRFPDSAAETKYVAAWAPGHGWAMAEVDPASAGKVRLALPAAEGRIRGCVKDESGVALAGVEVRVAWFDLRGEGTFARLGVGAQVGWTQRNLPTVAGAVDEMPEGWTTITGADGSFEIREVPLQAGHVVTLEFRRDGYRGEEKELESEEWIDVKLQESR